MAVEEKKTRGWGDRVFLNTNYSRFTKEAKFIVLCETMVPARGVGTNLLLHRQPSTNSQIATANQANS